MKRIHAASLLEAMLFQSCDIAALDFSILNGIQEAFKYFFQFWAMVFESCMATT